MGFRNVLTCCSDNVGGNITLLASAVAEDVCDAESKPQPMQ